MQFQAVGDAPVIESLIRNPAMALIVPISHQIDV
jgi:hypothetical protein